MPTVSQILTHAARQLEAVTETPRLDAEILLAHAAGISRTQLLTRLRDTVDAPNFTSFLNRRLMAEPIAYITGEWEFFSLPFKTRAPILVPRPETEHLVEAALEHAQARGLSAARVLDLCSGSGCVAVAIARNMPGSRVWAADIDHRACDLMRENALRQNVSLEVRQGNLFDALDASVTPVFDVIVANPPYVETGEWTSLSRTITEFEDARALLAGEDGLDVLRRIIGEAPQHLAPRGLLAVEMGEKHASAVSGMLQNAGFLNIRLRYDLGGIARIAQGTLPPA